MRRVLGGLTAAVLLLSGCGGDEAQADVRRFCELIEQYNKGTGFEQPEEQTPEALTKALRDYLTLPEIQATLDELRDVAPEQVRADVVVMTDVADELRETGKSRFEEEDATKANEAIVAFTTEECAPKDGGSDAPAQDAQGAESAEGEAAGEGEAAAPAES
jgi:hypothetical protein